MTILELKTLIANNLGSLDNDHLTVADLTVNGIDMALWALNASRRHAEFQNDFGFQRKMLTLSVDTITGGSLDAAVIQGTATTTDVKTIIEIGLFDSNNNFYPIEWTTSEESEERQREENRYRFMTYPSDWARYPTDAQAESWPIGQRRFILRNNTLFNWPLTDPTQASQTLAVGIEAVVFSADWTVTSGTIAVTSSTGQDGTYYKYGIYNSYPFYIMLNPTNGASPSYAIWFKTDMWYLTAIGDVGNAAASDRYDGLATSQVPASPMMGHGTFTGAATVTYSESDSTSDIWTTKGAEYLLWASVVRLNQRFKFFSARTEGNLPPPTDLAAAALATFIDWDTSRFEQYRRHGR